MPHYRRPLRNTIIRIALTMPPIERHPELGSVLMFLRPRGLQDGCGSQTGMFYHLNIASKPHRQIIKEDFYNISRYLIKRQRRLTGLSPITVTKALKVQAK